MTDKQILRKAIEKAVKNSPNDFAICYYPTFLYRKSKGLENKMNIIFSHDFAKAFWKDDKTKWNIQARLSVHFKNLKWYLESAKGEFLCPIFIPAWQYHLQRMVLEKEPLKYLERFL